MNLIDLRNMDIKALHAKAKSIGLEYNRQSRQELLFAIQKLLSKKGAKMILEGPSSGVLEIVQDGYGFLRSPQTSYHPGPDDIYVPPQIIKQYRLKTGVIFSKVTLRPPNRGERYFAVDEVFEVNMRPVQEQVLLVPFGDKPAEFPTEWLQLEQGSGHKSDTIGRMIDIVAPIGKGQRSLIVAPPKTGKTVMLQSIANAILKSNPECKVFMLLLDERPEEVTDNMRSVDAEIIASPFDNPPSRHIQVAEMVLAKAKRLAESGDDVVIFLDSITRLARAYNHVAATDNKILSGGISASALQRPKRFFGAARNLMDGGSLSIIATALIDTGSKADEVIYEEFKGTGNHEIHLMRHLAQKRIYPALDVKQSGTRKEEILVSAEYLNYCWILRKYLQTMDEAQATELVIQRVQATKTNEKFFESMKET
ncbi:transcription termination factor Rho [Candidatus Synchoanobacter obligatus]|uniref:Transcription termination factor Rho n=1 Tax=Candidatus Synchoanobacter obligatus TaxID=2919597 RepID=A0ABT1L5S2_9GAMM|nr:transcription termination factor Rho [Candidatus Synchoanobacter obligatus]